MWVSKALIAVAALFPHISLAEDGKSLYEDHCATCHQADGYGVPFINPPLVDSAVVAGDPSTLSHWVLNGNSPDDAGYESEFSGLMPGFDQLSDAELAAILNYIRQEFADIPPSLTEEDLHSARP